MTTFSKKYIPSLAIIATSTLLLSGCLGSSQSTDAQLNTTSIRTTPPVANTLPKGTMKQLSDFAPIEAKTATIVTSKGDITVELYRDQAPLTTLNWLSLAKSGFYDGVVFHRVIADFMAQVGDPLSKDESKKAMWGTGGPGYAIADEFGEGLKHDSEGILSMANSGPNTGGSQFFITFGPTTWLDGKHAIFGKVTKGLDVLKSIEMGDTIEHITLQ
jgi:cyclophilin family peptidyl-prolyl cis-trans isomerase